MGSPLRNAFIALGCAVVLAGAGLRFFDLGGKVIHADEAVQAWKTGELLQGAGYRYDPTDHHGPTLYYLGALVSWLIGERSVATLEIAHLRVLPALAGSALVALTLSFGFMIGGRAAVLGAIFTAFSPLLVYYSRHYVQEPLFVLFGAGTLLSLWRWRQTGRLAWAMAIGICVGLMIATKETWLLVALALGLGWFAAGRCAGDSNAKDTPGFNQSLLVAAMSAALVTILFYTSFFTHWVGLVDAGRGLIAAVHKSADAGHAKPWFYFAGLLGWSSRPPFFWSEAGILFFALAAVPLLPRQPAVRFLGVYTLVSIVIHSLIPYKTPWLACGFWYGMALLAGCGAARLTSDKQAHVVRIVAGAVIAAVMGHLGWQAYRAAGPLAGHPRNPYGYVETSRDLRRLPDRLAQLAAVHPAGKKFELSVAVSQPWPLPWLLREFPGVDYRLDDPANLAGDALLVSPEYFDQLPPEIRGSFPVEYFGLRDGELLILTVEPGLWERSLDSTPDHEDQ